MPAIAKLRLSQHLDLTIVVHMEDSEAVTAATANLPEGEDFIACRNQAEHRDPGTERPHIRAVQAP